MRCIGQPHITMTNFQLRGFVYPFNANMNNIKEYYTTTFPTDELGAELNESADFQGLYAVLCMQHDVYDYIDVADSLVRERLFERLAEMYGLSYDDVYNQWAMSFED